MVICSFKDCCAIIVSKDKKGGLAMIRTFEKHKILMPISAVGFCIIAVIAVIDQEIILKMVIP